ncbi:uncharacterized protein LOC34620417 [Cyclospora cayetanensis]|uniref:Uncharacterized protein LOC34620417 n=1 Tax=Cyclospora cayetanensis TaxID=88456 RepID=A0A6P6RZG1_9EIME|nr:uncharacterized protein LOC34620417 [Cyclospora cayetanensis]
MGWSARRDLRAALRGVQEPEAAKDLEKWNTSTPMGQRRATMSLQLISAFKCDSYNLYFDWLVWQFPADASGSFSWAHEASPCAYARLCRAGFLPVAESFHHSSIDKAFDEVLGGCVRRHGENWLWRPVRQCLRALHRRTLRDAHLGLQGPPNVARIQENNTESGSSSSSSTSNTQCSSRDHLCAPDVKVHSFEIWTRLCDLERLRLLPLKPQRELNTASTRQTVVEASAVFSTAEASEGPGAAGPDLSEVLSSLGSSSIVGAPSSSYKGLCLVAGEIGVSVGQVYTSLTAFTDADSAGAAQIAAVRLLLRTAGYQLLDFGMPLPYKETLGAKRLPRHLFLKLFKKLRERETVALDAAMQQCCQAVLRSKKDLEGTTDGNEKDREKEQDGHKEKKLEEDQEKNVELRRGCEAKRKRTSGILGAIPQTEKTERDIRLPQGFWGCCELLQLLGNTQNAPKACGESIEHS